MWNYLKTSTLKREFAAVIVGWLLYTASVVIYGAPTDTRVQVLSLFVLPIFALAGAAFGLDWISKQTNIAGPPTNDAANVIAENEIEVPTVTKITTTAAEPKGSTG